MRVMIAISSALLSLLIVMTGCSSPDSRLADYAQQATERQARQNESMARQSEQIAIQSRELAQAAHELVEQDATARRELIQAHDQAQAKLQVQRIDLDEQRRQLHAERQNAARAAVRAPVIAEAIVATGLILAALLPLIVTAYALSRLPDQSPAELLLGCEIWEELLSRDPLLPSPEPAAQVPADSAPRLAGPRQSAAGETAPELPTV